MVKNRLLESFFAVFMLALGTAVVVAAAPAPAPEINPAAGGSALAVLAGALVILQGRRKR